MRISDWSSDVCSSDLESSNPALQQILQQRLARLLIDAGKAEEALQVLGDADDPASLEVRGDASVALDKREEARKSYSEVLAQLDIASPGQIGRESGRERVVTYG